MRNTLLVIKYEIITTLSKPSFWLMAFLFPVFILLISLGPQFLAQDMGGAEQLALPGLTGAVGEEAAGEETAVTPPLIGYVDEANLITALPAAFPPDMLRAFPDETAAQAALRAGEIEEYYLIPADYVATGQLYLVSQQMTLFGSSSQGIFEYVINSNLTGDEAITAVIYQPTIISESLALAAAADIEAVPDATSAAMAFTVPFIAMFIFFFLITMSSGYMLQSVSREKENRTVEVLLVSLEPRQLMLGKMIGLSAVALLQMAIWAGAGLLALRQGGDMLGTLTASGLSAGFFIWTLLYFVLGYLMYASLMGAIGALVPSAREGGQFTFFVLLPLLIPIWLNFVFINTPNSPLAVGLSIFPLTAPVAMITRMVATTVPFWQLAASLLAQGITAYLFVLLAAYFFRADTLLSNTAVSWRRLFAMTRRQAAQS
jgi:ABC-2 type transport system permease protein